MKIIALLFSPQVAATLLLSVVLAACNVVVEDGPGYRPHPPRPGPQLCTREYAPVCARRGHERRTFANSCEARRAGYRVTDRGQCRGGGDWGQRPDRPKICTREYRPVCARRGNSVRTFGNACTARAANYRVVKNHAC